MSWWRRRINTSCCCAVVGGPARGTSTPSRASWRCRPACSPPWVATCLGRLRAWFRCCSPGTKDEDGIYEDEPKKHPSAKHIARISASDLLARNMPDLVVERVVVEYLTRSRFCKEVQIINGLKAGNVTRALEGEDVGTIIH